MKTVLLLLLPALCILTSCAAQPAPTTQPTTPALAAEGDPVEAPREERIGAGSVTHAVFVWLKKPGDADGRKALIDASKGLRAIPGVVDVQAGEVLPSTRPIVDSSYDVGLVVTFIDAKAMQNYLTHPAHLKLLNEVLKPNADHYKVFDFTNK